MKTTPTTKSAASIYRNQNALLRALFERASDPRKVLCVALDYAKRKHVALCCDGNGDTFGFSVPWSSTASPTSTREAAPAPPQTRNAPTRHCTPGSSLSANGAPSPMASLSLPRKPLPWDFGAASLWNRAPSTFPCGHEAFAKTPFSPRIPETSGAHGMRK